MTSANLETSEITSIPSLNDFFATLQDENVSKCIESITYDINSQTMVIKMQKLLKHESESVEQLHEKVKDSVDERIRMLSESYRENFPELQERFKQWKPVRENLIKILSSSSDRLDRNFSIVSSFRVITSAADIFGTLGRRDGKSVTSWSNFAMEHSSTLGLLSLVAERIIAKYTLKGVRRAIKSDQDIFRKIAEWFKQTEELDKAVKNIFPFGIDPDIAKKIDISASDFNDCNKIFMSIIASNARENVNLFKDEKFLDRADQFANSEAGKQWFHKVLLKNDPNLNHHLNAEINDEIQCLLRNPPTDNPELIVDGYRVLSSKVRLKNTLNLITLITAASNLLFGNKPEESEILRDLSSKTKEELEGIKKIVLSLKPTSLALDPDLL